jgi:hypothetical protein
LHKICKFWNFLQLCWKVAKKWTCRICNLFENTGPGILSQTTILCHHSYYTMSSHVHDHAHISKVIVNKLIYGKVWHYYYNVIWVELIPPLHGEISRPYSFGSWIGRQVVGCCPRGISWSPQDFNSKYLSNCTFHPF